ncbi:sensor histidine kinase [Amycolatopsis cihanbeyliensis]|uniref:histidine kinase n=1 Tax=Amycolatopsis cihanbeyliensis TaxID=1128664 RepID=A0A542DGR8_AMYCI|nr:sensor domain-containing protein [Amycolatopsis cihanbeyliensis]TQJ02231.1 signal transduction histidine kinase [Amycolatopsis cihanbeyliensis]
MSTVDLPPARTLLRRFLLAPVRRRAWAELGWVAIGVPLATLCLLLVLVGLVAGFALTLAFLGLLLAPGALYLARRFGGMHRVLAGPLLGLRVPAPPLRPMEPGLGNWIRARLAEPASWRAVAYLLLRLPLAVIELVLLASVLVFGFAAFTYPIWWFPLDGELMPVYDIHTESWGLSLAYGALGALVLLVVPWLLHGLTGVDRLLVRGLLGPVTLSERIRDLERSRASAVEDATDTLRRIERDLHDGAQARLAALAMKLGVAKDELAAEPVDLEQVRELVSAAHGGAKQALSELRDLARGIRPAGLEAGLRVALSTLAAHSALTVRVDVALPERPSPALETILYFSAAELLANATKHSGASTVDIEVGPNGDTLLLEVTDYGEGGASVRRGGGLAGLRERAGTVDGWLTVLSPRGGPTVVRVELPAGR